MNMTTESGRCDFVGFLIAVKDCLVLMEDYIDLMQKRRQQSKARLKRAVNSLLHVESNACEILEKLRTLDFEIEGEVDLREIDFDTEFESVLQMEPILGYSKMSQQLRVFSEIAEKYCVLDSRASEILCELVNESYADAQACVLELHFFDDLDTLKSIASHPGHDLPDRIRQRLSRFCKLNDESISSVKKSLASAVVRFNRHAGNSERSLFHSLVYQDGYWDDDAQRALDLISSIPMQEAFFQHYVFLYLLQTCVKYSLVAEVNGKEQDVVFVGWEKN